jgi:hypothetical protein
MRAMFVVLVLLLCVASATSARAGGQLAPRPIPLTKPTPTPTPAPAIFTVLELKIVTGNDDLRGDSSATADVWYPNGDQDHCTLKAQSDGGWSKGSTTTVDCHLSKARSIDELRKSWIWIGLQSHDSFGESPDNWNIQHLAIIATEIGGHNLPSCVFFAGGNPLARLTNSTPKVNISTLNGHC